MTDAPVAVEDKKTGFIRGLGLLDSTMIVAGSMIGSGIFIVSADMSRQVGSPGWLLVAWIITGLLTVMAALSYGELAAMMPHAGGQYVYLREAFSPLWGFLYGWTLFMVIQTGTIAAVAVGFARYFGVLVPWISESNYLIEPIRIGSGYAVSLSTAQFVGILMIALLTWMNTRGLRLGKIVQNVFTITKTGALIALIVLGVLVGWNAEVVTRNFGDMWTVRGTLQDVGPGLTAITAFGLFVGLCVSQTNSLFSADAWNNITFTAGEVKNPRRNIPLSLALGTFLVISLYLLANVAYLVTLPFEGDRQKTEVIQLANQYKADPNYKNDPAKLVIIKTADQYEEQAKTDPRILGIQNAPSDRVASSTAEVIFPGLGAAIMAVAIMISTFGCNNGLILAGARAYWAMARDGLFFRSSGELNSKHVPAWGLVIQGIWAAVLVLPRVVTGTDPATGKPTYGNLYGNLLTYVISAALIFYILTILGIFVLRWKRPDAERPYRAFGYPVIPALYIVGAAVILVVLLIYQWPITWPGFIIILTGIPVYLIWRRVGKPMYDDESTTPAEEAGL
ncbi:MAG TPA: amino acid permease [Blastocatellia bacterium]|nr:amino acid permease [Blastocatellia bacterium]